MGKRFFIRNRDLENNSKKNKISDSAKNRKESTGDTILKGDEIRIPDSLSV